jgi:hypothetical protein
VFLGGIRSIKTSFFVQHVNKVVTEVVSVVIECATAYIFTERATCHALIIS